MTNRSNVIARDPRIAAILVHPDAYFAAARRRAWPRARREIEVELGRARARRGAYSLIRRLCAGRDSYR